MASKSEEEWEDVLGTGTVLKQVLVKGRVPDEELDMEAPRKFFALIDIETRTDEGKLVGSESHRNFLINIDADLFPGAHLVIPLMDINEKSRYLFDSKFCFGEQGLDPEVKPHAKLDCIITLKIRSPYDSFLEQLTAAERLQLANRKRERGRFWYSRSNYQNAITIYQSISELCALSDETTADEKIVASSLRHLGDQL